MTTEDSTMRESVAVERERLAAEAFERIRSGQHWSDWRYVAQGLETGRNRAMSEAYTNEPAGRRYNEAFGRWMDRNPWSRKIDKATRNHLLWVADHLPQIEAWRETLPANQRDQWNHPTSVKRAYERAMRVQVEKAEGRAGPTPMQAARQALVDAETERDHWRRQAEESGSLFDLRHDTPEQIARVLVESVTPSRAEQIVRAIRVELKRQRAHAG
jgi:hypothetical protein